MVYSIDMEEMLKISYPLEKLHEIVHSWIQNLVILSIIVYLILLIVLFRALCLVLRFDGLGMIVIVDLWKWIRGVEVL
jgi:hypothetical protein